MKSNIKRITKFASNLWDKGAFHIFFGTFLTKFVAFFGSIFLVRAISKSSYGLLAYIENIYGYIYLLAGFGYGTALLRYLIKGESLHEKKAFYNYAVKRGTIINLIIVVIVILASSLYSHPEEFYKARYLLPIILLALPFQYLLDCSNHTFRGMLDNKRYAVVAFITTASLIVGRYLGAIIYDVKGILIAKIGIMLLYGVTLITLTNKQYFRKIEPQIIGNDLRKEYNSYSIQYMITNGLWVLFMLNDVFLLGILSGSSTIVADYKVAYVLPGNLSIISTAMGMFIAPIFVKHEDDKKWVWSNYKKVLLVVFGSIFIIASFIFIFASPIVNFIYGKEYVSVVPVLKILLISAVINSGLRYTTANILSYMGHVKYNLLISLVGIVIQISLNLMMIPRFGAMGAAYTSIFAYSFMAIIFHLIFIKKFKAN